MQNSRGNLRYSEIASAASCNRLLALPLLARREFHAFVTTIIDANALVLHDLLAEQSSSRSSSSVSTSIACRVCGILRASTVPSPSSAPRIAPHISWPPNALVEDLRNGIEGQLAGLGDHNVHHTHQIIRRVHCMECIVMQEHMQAAGRMIAD
jgi:hypothetical protein